MSILKLYWKKDCIVISTYAKPFKYGLIHLTSMSLNDIEISDHMPSSLGPSTPEKRNKKLKYLWPMC